MPGPVLQEEPEEGSEKGPGEGHHQGGGGHKEPFNKVDHGQSRRAADGQRREVELYPDAPEPENQEEE